MKQNHNLDRVRHIVAVAAGKGGVGKSTLSLSLALFFLKKGYKVGIMDADLYGPSLQKMFPAEIAPKPHATIPERIIPASSQGMQMISMAYFLKDGDAAAVRAPIANGIIKQFIHLVDWGELDFLFVDFPPGTGDIQLTLMQECTLAGAVLVTTPQEIALLDVAKAAQSFQQMQIPIIGVVENMSYLSVEENQKLYPFGEKGGERFALENGYVLLGAIPIDPVLSKCGDEGRSIFEDHCLGAAAQSLASVAERIEEQLEAFHHLSKDRLKNFELQWK